ALALSTAVIEKSTDACPSGIMTLAGTVASSGSLLVRLTTTASVVPKLRDTVAVATPPFSAMLPVGTATLNVGVSAVVKLHAVVSAMAPKPAPNVLPVTEILSTAHHQLF